MPVIIDVAVAVIHYHDYYLLAYRNRYQHQGDRYEFVGGKVEAGEFAPSALIREVQEEVGLLLSHDQLIKLGRIRHDYGDKEVRLHIYKVTLTTAQYQQLSHCETGKEGQALRWVNKSDLTAAAFPLPDANRPILAWLLLPEAITITYPISHFKDYDDPLIQWVNYHRQHLSRDATVYLRPKVDEWLQSGGVVSLEQFKGERGLEALKANISLFKSTQANFDDQSFDISLGQTQSVTLTLMVVLALMQARPDLKVVLPASDCGVSVSNATHRSNYNCNQLCSQCQPEPTSAEASTLAKDDDLTVKALSDFYNNGQIVAHHLSQNELMATVAEFTGHNEKLSHDSNYNCTDLPPDDYQRPLIISCHDQESIKAGNKLASFRIDHQLEPVIGMLISPVLPTATHPNAINLGWSGLKTLSELADLPVIALGGLSPSALNQANCVGSVSVAGIREFMQQ